MRASFSKVANALTVASFALICTFVACGDDSDNACSSWCGVVEECTDVSFSDCMNGCAEEISQAGAVSPQCANAIRDQNVCLGALTCPEFEAWLQEVPPDTYPCKAADDAVDDACGG